MNERCASSAVSPGLPIIDKKQSPKREALRSKVMFTCHPDIESNVPPLVLKAKMHESLLVDATAQGRGVIRPVFLTFASERNNR